jgi:hypothetical protein
MVATNLYLIVLSLTCGLYKCWICIIFLSCLYSGIYQIVLLSIVRLCVWPIELIVAFYLEDIFVLMIGRIGINDNEGLAT